jgi:Family of unknown function (DUF6909)
MDRTVPRTGSEEVELYIRTYYSLLRSTTDVQIRSLEEVHANMGSSLHSAARSLYPDMSAFIYSSLRLPACITETERVVLGQSQEVFEQGGMGDLHDWRPVAAKARRRRSFYDGRGTLGCLIASRSDIDDIIPILTAFQIEWNKLHRLMRGEQVQAFLADPIEGEEGLAALGHGIGVEPEDLDRLRQVWDEDFWPMMSAIASSPKNLKVKLLAGSLTDYRRATQLWWDRVEDANPSILHRPVYFVSSNAHSVVNLFSGFALRQEEALLRYLGHPQHADLLEEWNEIELRQVPSSRENFLYYALKKYLASPEGAEMREVRAQAERECGIQRITSDYGFDLQVQLVDLQRIKPNSLDPRLRASGLETMIQSDALVINIEYPLGMGSFEFLSYISTRVGEMRGVYIMGKAATLNGIIGDVMLPSVVHDEQSQNTYLFENCFSAAEFGEDLVYGTLLDNQKAVSVRGTFLQTPRYMDVFYREGYTDIEMEAGPYLSAVYEMYRPKRHPNNEIVNLYGLPFDLGVIHYASDTPLSKGKNLGAGTLSYFGMDPTYAASLAIWRRIFDLEMAGIRRAPALAVQRS